MGYEACAITFFKLRQSTWIRKLRSRPDPTRTRTRTRTFTSLRPKWYEHRPFSILPNQSAVWTYHRVEHIDWRTILILPGFQTFHLHEFLTKYYLKKEVDQSTWICSLCPRTKEKDKETLTSKKKATAWATPHHLEQYIKEKRQNKTLKSPKNDTA